MPSQQSTKSDLVTGRDVEDDGLEMRNRGKESGTEADMQDMRMLGRTQQLNVSMIASSLLDSAADNGTAQFSFHFDPWLRLYFDEHLGDRVNVSFLEACW
jgi:hypothetical protein